MPYVIKDAATAAENSNEVQVTRARGTRPCVFRAPGLAGVEYANLMYKGTDGLFYPALDESGVPLQISTTRDHIAVYACGIYRLEKSNTVAAVPMEISTDDNP